MGVSGRSLDVSLFSVNREARAPVGSEEGKELEVGGGRRGKLKWKRAAEREEGQAVEVCAPEAPVRPGQDDCVFLLPHSGAGCRQGVGEAGCNS